MAATTLQTEVLDRLKAALAQALTETAEEMLRVERADAVIPMDTGRLQNEQTCVDSARARDGTVQIVTDAPQAARLYFHPDYHFRHDKNANARGEWWEPWITGSRRNEPAALFAAFARKHTKEIL